MSRTHKDRKKRWRSKARVAAHTKEDARVKRKTMKNEDNPRALKYGSADRWRWD